MFPLFINQRDVDMTKKVAEQVPAFSFENYLDETSDNGWTLEPSKESILDEVRKDLSSSFKSFKRNPKQVLSILSSYKKVEIEKFQTDYQLAT